MNEFLFERIAAAAQQTACCAGVPYSGSAGLSEFEAVLLVDVCPAVPHPVFAYLLAICMVEWDGVGR